MKARCPTVLMPTILGMLIQRCGEVNKTHPNLYAIKSILQILAVGVVTENVISKVHNMQKDAS